MHLPQLVYCDLCQLRDTVNVTQSVVGEVAKLVLYGSNALLEPNRRDGVAVAIRGSDADGNDHLPLGFWQLFVIERYDDDSLAPRCHSKNPPILVPEDCFCGARATEFLQDLLRTPPMIE
jgi:hypothetical protein